MIENSKEQNKVPTIEELKELMCIPDDVCSEDKLENIFAEIADILLFHAEINIGEGISYTIEEIEFYYFKNRCFNGPIYSCTYPRNCKPSDFFFHYSGVDICFQSTEESFGGVLIRSIKRVRDSKKELIGGPMRCAMELLNTCIQTGNTMELIVNEYRIKTGNRQTTIRQGIAADYEIKEGEVQSKVQYCYFIPQDNQKWIGTRNQKIEQYKLKKESSSTKIITKNDLNYNYLDNPEARISRLTPKPQDNSTF